LPATGRAAAQGAGPVFLLAATLRPETMYGQTNAWALPEGAYGAFRAPGGAVYVMTERAARNLSWQDRLPPTGAPERLLALTGQDLIGVPLRVRARRGGPRSGRAGARRHAP
jgi:leucyl-tRNA synthetase